MRDVAGFGRFAFGLDSATPSTVNPVGNGQRSWNVILHRRHVGHRDQFPRGMGEVNLRHSLTCLPAAAMSPRPSSSAGMS